MLATVKDALAEQGFGTLSEIDLQATLAAKIGKDIPQLVIVRACNPHLASRALEAEPDLMAQVSGNADVQPIADEARQLMNNALARIQERAAS